jgi:hypothetical protein
MRAMRRVRNLAFVALVVTLAWAGQAKLRAESGGFFCGYGYCTLTYDDCNGTWDYASYPDGGTTEPGDCLIIYHPGLIVEGGGGGGGTCYINLSDSGGYYWSVSEQCGSDWCFACVQR